MATLKIYTEGEWVEVAPPSAGGTWGSITGTLSAQTDLNAALNINAFYDFI